VVQYTLSYANMPPHVWVTNKAKHVHIILIKRRQWQIKIEQPCSDTMLNCLYINWIIIKQVMHISSNESRYCPTLIKIQRIWKWVLSHIDKIEGLSMYICLWVTPPIAN